MPEYPTLGARATLLKPDHVKVLCTILNRDGRAGPWADEESLPLFTRHYIRLAIRKWIDRLTPEGQALAEEARQIVGLD